MTNYNQPSNVPTQKVSAATAGAAAATLIVFISGLAGVDVPPEAAAAAVTVAAFIGGYFIPERKP